MPHSALAFQHYFRAVCTYAASANILCENLVAVRRGHSGPVLRLLCDIHRTARVYGDNFKGPSSEYGVTGMIRLALSIRTGGAFSCFRRCLEEEVRALLKVMRGRRSYEALRYKRGLVYMFVANAPAALKRSIILGLCPKMGIGAAKTSSTTQT